MWFQKQPLELQSYKGFNHLTETKDVNSQNYKVREQKGTLTCITRSRQAISLAKLEQQSSHISILQNIIKGKRRQ